MRGRSRFSAREVVLLLALVGAVAFATGASGAVKRSFVSIVDGKKPTRKAQVLTNGAIRVRQTGPIDAIVGNEVKARISGPVDAKVSGAVDARITAPVDARITAPVDARVTGTVSAAPGGLENAFSTQDQGRLGLGYVNLVTAQGSDQVALSQIVLSARGPNSTTAQEILIESFNRTSGSQECTGPGTAGYERHTLARVLVLNQTSEQVRFTDPPLLVPKGGDRICIGFTAVTIPSGSATNATATGYVLK